MRRALAVPLMTALALVAGCEALAPHPVVDGDRCAKLKQAPDGGEDEGRLVILVDSSNSTRTNTAGGPTYTAALEQTIAEAVGRGDRVSVGSFSGGVHGFDQTGFRTRSGSKNETNRAHDAKVAKDCVREAVVEAEGEKPRSPGSDILAAWRDAADWVRTVKGGKQIVIATDGLTTTGCADLTKATFSGAAELATIVEVCKGRKEIRPKDLSGVRLSMIGVGRVAPEQPAGTPEQLHWLQELWRALCAAGEAEHCEISTAMVSGREGEPGTTRAAVPDVPDPVVGFRQVFTIVLGSAALFDTNQSVLRPEALTTLQRIAVDIRTLKYSKVEVAGHADARGDPGHNQALSERRAAAVAGFLAGNGVAGVKPIGYGENKPACNTSQTDPACLQQNRRVEITVYRA